MSVTRAAEKKIDSTDDQIEPAIGRVRCICSNYSATGTVKAAGISGVRRQYWRRGYNNGSHSFNQMINGTILHCVYFIIRDRELKYLKIRIVVVELN